jgi:branched-chain amino acid transport system permease protein
LEYIFHIVVLAGIYTILAESLNLLVGQTGLLSVAHAAFYGLGAYTSALLAHYTGVPFLLSIPFGMVVAIIASMVVSSASLRLHDDYFVIATLAFQMLFFAVSNNFIGLTRGPLGILDIPRPVFWGWSIHSPLGFAVLSVSLAGFTLLVVALITSSPFGRVLLAIREDEIFAAALGKNTTKVKIIVIAISGALAASAGGLYAHYTTYISPQNFTVVESILIISMVIIGGTGSLWGPILGAILLVLLPEVLRFLGLPSSTAAHIRQIIYGALLIVFMMWRPKGLLGYYAFNAGESRN